MSSNQSSSYSYSSTSYSSSSSTGGGPGETYSKSETTRASYDDRHGGQAERVTEETGKPTLVETTQIPTSGGRVEGTSGDQGRITDVSDEEAKEADRRYLEAMEDEYAKREGGA